MLPFIGWPSPSPINILTLQCFKHLMIFLFLKKTVTFKKVTSYLCFSSAKINIVSFAMRILFEGESKLICIIKGLCFQQSFCDFFVGKENVFVYVVVNFLSRVIIIFLLFLGIW